MPSRGIYGGTMLRFYGIDEREVRAANAASTHGDVAAISAITNVTVDRFMAAGDADDLRRGLDRLQACGFTEVSFSGVLGPEPHTALEMLSAELARRGTATAAAESGRR
ncbi:MAG: hypothetical protein M3Q72_04365 [Actinomycetota bacterium]|nr:hypothetical protein [Actinomycetota bacterium]